MSSRNPLPGMPIALGDPGVFMCSINDGIPPPPERAKPAPPPRPQGGVWLVLALCPACNPRTGRYCSAHNADNWWLTTWRR